MGICSQPLPCQPGLLILPHYSLRCSCTPACSTLEETCFTLWIFGDNVEDRFGHVKFSIFYLLCGLAATAAQLVFSLDSNIPNLGASGAIAGVLGAYILLFPKAKVSVLQGQRVVPVPALIVIGLWFVLQLFSGIGSIASTSDTGGVAYMAHIGGFVAGLVLALLFRGKPK